MMAITIKAPAQWANKSETKRNWRNIFNSWIAFTQNKVENKASWFIILLCVQCILFMSLPVLLIVYYHEPLNILGITLAVFFATIISELQRPGLRTLITLFAFALIDLFMLAVFVI